MNIIRYWWNFVDGVEDIILACRCTSTLTAKLNKLELDYLAMRKNHLIEEIRCQSWKEAYENLEQSLEEHQKPKKMSIVSRGEE